jgi:hypothetical protein
MGHNNMMDTPHYAEEINLSSSSNINKKAGQYKPLTQNDREMQENLIIRERPTEPRRGFFSKYIVGPLAYVGSFFCGRRDNESAEENRIFADLPERVVNMNSFSTIIKTRVGLLVLYQAANSAYFENLVREIRQQDYILDILVSSTYN